MKMKKELEKFLKKVKKVKMLQKIGTQTQWGKIKAILWIRERYYMCSIGKGDVSLMPAT